MKYQMNMVHYVLYLDKHGADISTYYGNGYTNEKKKDIKLTIDN